MVDFDKEFNGFSSSDKPDRDLSLPDELREVFHTLSAVPETVRPVFLLHLGGLDLSEIALLEQVALPVAEKRLEKAWLHLNRYVERRLTEPESGQTAGSGGFFRRLFACIPPDHLDIYRRFWKGEPVEWIANDRNLSAEAVERRVAAIQADIHEQVALAVDRFLEIDADLLPPLDRIRFIRLEVADDVDRFQLSEAERLDAENAFFDLDADYREVFESAAVHIKPRKIARLLAVTPADVEKRLKKANRFFSERMERLVAAYILHKKGHPNAPRLSRTRALAARAVYGALAPDCRKAFGLFRAMGCSEQEIAEKLNLELNEVRLRIRQAKKSIRSRVLTTAVLAARKGEDIPTARERIIWRLNYLVSVRQGRQAMPPLPVPDTLTDAEKREVELLFRALEPIRRDVYALHRGLGLEPKETADCLDISREEVAAQVHAVQDGFGERLMQLVAVLLRRAAFVPDTPDMAPSVTETARIAYRFLSEAQQEFFRLYTLSNESVPELADRLGLTADEVAGRLDGVRSTLILRAEILLTSWLREVTDGRMRAETIFRNIEKRREGIFEEDDVTEHGDETDSFINAELIEARKSLMLLDYDCREAFVFGIGAGLGAETVARYQNVSVDEANRRMLDAREMIRLRTEQLMTGMLQLKLSQPDAPRMKETEFYAAKAAFRFIPKECRSVYVRYAVHAEMLGEIARKLNLPYDVAETRLETAVKMVVSRSFAVAIAATSGFKGGEPVAEALLGDPKKIRFPADVWYEPPSQTTDAPQAEPAPTKCRNPVVAALAFLAGPPVQLGAAASNAETMALTGLWTAIPTVASLYVGMPIWTLWLLGTEFVVGCVLLRTVPTLPARVQLVKQLFCLYSAAFILPFALLLADWGLYELSGLKLHRWAAFSIYLVGNITPFIWTINHCRRWRSTESGSNDRPEQLRAFLNRGFTAEAFVLAAFFVLLGQDMLCGPSGQPGGASLWPIFALAACFVGLFHLLAYCAFRYFCRFSKGAADSRKHESIPPPKESF